MVNMKLSDFVRTSTIHMLILCTRRYLQPFPVALFRRNGERQTNFTGNCNIAILTSRGTYFFHSYFLLEVFLPYTFVKSKRLQTIH